MTKLYICNFEEPTNDNYKGLYYLITETGEIIIKKECNGRLDAREKLYAGNQDVVFYTVDNFGRCECVFLGNDDMTIEELQRRCSNFNNKEI